MLQLILISFFSLFSLFVGIFLIIKPELAIEIQRRFYAQINWRIEPISKELEIRNTRIMGGFVIILLIATLILVVIHKLSP